MSATNTNSVAGTSKIASQDLQTEKGRVLELCEQFKQGITSSVIENDMPQLTKRDIVFILNGLLSERKLLLLKKQDGTPMYKLKDAVTQHKLRGVDREEQAVYEIIERSGNMGIWARKIRSESNLHLNTVDKVLKKLEGKKLIKSINSVQAPKKKIYLVCSIEPDRSLTGGAFYSDNQFDSTFVDILMETCFKYMEGKVRSASSRSASDGPLAAVNSSKVTAKEMREYIDKLKLAKIKLGVEDVEKLLDTLVLDGRVACYSAGFTDGSAGVKLWRAVPDWAPQPHILSVPCGVCPFINRCADIGNITPQNCEYMEEWLCAAL